MMFSSPALIHIYSDLTSLLLFEKIVNMLPIGDVRFLGINSRFTCYKF